jgi:hypothetical protein
MIKLMELIDLFVHLCSNLVPNGGGNYNLVIVDV